MAVDTSSELLFLRDNSGVYNATAILQLINSYSADERQLLFDHLNVSSLEELAQLFYPAGNSKASAADRLKRFVEYRVHVQLLLYVPPIFFVVKGLSRK